MRSAPVVSAAVALVALTASTALTGCSGGTQRLPQTFPSAVPVVQGTVLHAQRDRYEWHLWVASADPVGGYRAARGDLLRRGFSETADTETTGGSDGQFCDPTWCVGITGYTDPEYGASVLYVVAHTSGLGPPVPL